MTWSTIFIIDPVYTLPLLVGVIAALVITRERPLGHRLNWAGLALSTAYLAWTVGAKFHVEHIARESLVRQGIAYERLLTGPAPLNSVLWRILATHENGYHEGFYSFFDDESDISMRAYPSERKLLNGIADHWPVKRLRWFTKGFYSVTRIDHDVIVTDLRMGVEESYAFRFKVGVIGNPHTRPSPAERLVPVREYGRLKNVWARIWDEDAKI